MLRVRELERRGERSCSTHRVVRPLTGFSRGETVGLTSPLAGTRHGPVKQQHFISERNRKLGGHLQSPPPVTQYTPLY